MKYMDELLTVKNYNETVTGIEHDYNCWSIGYKEIDKIVEYEPCVILTSIAIPSTEKRILIRKYLSIGFYRDIEELKSIDAFGKCTDIYFIKLNDQTPNFIIDDINKKHSIF